MKSSTPLSSLALLAAVVAARKCVNITVPVTISAVNDVFDLTAPATNVAATSFILNLTQQSGNFTQTIYKGQANISGTYSLAATYCTPDDGPSRTVQLLTHGIAFDRSYWDFPAQEHKYSYVAAANRAGYATLAWDRLGLGQSSRGEPVNEIQSYLEVEALAALTHKLRMGELPGIKEKAEKVVHVGHSFGSIQSYTLAQWYPQLSDGLVLTGFSQNSSFVPFFALGGNFAVANTLKPLKGYQAGYLASGDVSGAQTNFFSPDMFDPEILDLASETGAPVTVGELLTIGAGTGKPSNFSGPVLVITGARDIPFCGGNCLGTGNPKLASLPAASKSMLPNANPFETVIVPNTGHGLNLEYSFPFTYKSMLDFITKNVGGNLH